MRLMSRAVWVVVLLGWLAIPAPAASQVSFGMSAGVSLASLTGDDVPEELDMRTGLNVGGFVEFPLADIIWLAPGLYYIQKGGSSDVPDGTIKIDYLEIPLLLRVGVSGRDPIGINLFLGPTFAFEVGCKFDFPTVTGDCDDLSNTGFSVETKSFDIGAAFGAGLSFGVSDNASINLTGIWDIGLMSIDDSQFDEDVKNEAILINVGFSVTP